MSYYDTTLTTEHYRDTVTGKTYRLRTVPDQDAESPRGDDNNPTVMLTTERSWKSPDKGSVWDYLPQAGEMFDYRNRVNGRRASRYLNLFSPDVLAYAFLGREDRDGTLYVTTTWDDDDYFEGIVLITKETWAMCMGEDYQGNLTPAQAIVQDVEVYNRWARGEYVGAILEELVTYERTTEGPWDGHATEPAQTRTEWSELDSSWGFNSEEYALEEARCWMPETVIEASESVSDDEDVA